MRDRMTTPVGPHEIGLHDELGSAARQTDFTDMRRRPDALGWGYKEAKVKSRGGSQLSGVFAFALTPDEVRQVEAENLTVHKCTSEDRVHTGYVSKGNLAAEWVEKHLPTKEKGVTIVYPAEI